MLVEYNLKLNKDIYGFIEKFKILTHVEKGDKVGRHDDKYYIEQCGNLQKFKRWWNNENRNKTFSYLNEDFTEFFKLCSKIPTQKENMFDLKGDLCLLITGLIPGLYNLKKSYEIQTDVDGDKLRCKIDSIILTFIDLKGQLGNNRNVSDPIGVKHIVPLNQEKACSELIQAYSL